MANDMQKALLVGLSALALASCNDGADEVAPAETAALWPAVESHLIDPAIEVRIDDLMAKMTLEQKKKCSCPIWNS